MIYSLWIYHWFNVLWHILLLIVKIHIGNNKILIGNKRFKVFKSTWFAVSLDKRTLHTWAEIETKPLISIYIHNFFPIFFKNYFALDILEFFFLQDDIYCSARSVFARVWTWPSLKHTLLIVINNVRYRKSTCLWHSNKISFRKKNYGWKGTRILSKALDKLSFSQFLGDCYHKLSQFFDTPRRMFTLLTHRIRYPVELNRIHSSCH